MWFSGKIYIKTSNTSILKTISLWLSFLFLLTTFVTYKPVIEFYEPFHSKILLSRLFGFPLIVLFVFKYFFQPKELFKFPKLFWGGFLLVLLLAATIPFSLNPYVTLRQVISITFLMLVSIAVFDAFKEFEWSQFAKLTTIILLLLSGIGMVNLILSILGYPTFLAKNRTDAGMSLFSRFYEAGAFTVCLVCISASLWASGLKKREQGVFRYLIPLSTVVGLFFLMSTGRVSAISGFVSAILFFMLWKRNLESFWFTLKMGSLFLFNLLIFFLFFPEIFDRFFNRFQSRIFKRVHGTQEADFIVDNFFGTFQAFLDHPISGTGLGGFQENYSRYAIHGSFLKMIGEAGLFGIIGMLIFLGLAVFGIFRLKKQTGNETQQFLYNFFPFFGGLLVSWQYNYILNNESFWVVIILLALVFYQAGKENTIRSKWI